MEELRNLQKIYSLAAGRFNQYEGKDFVLPEVFKQQVKEINSNRIIYNDYSAVIETKGSQNGVLNIYLPNQWFYIASYFTDFYNELLKYKKEALKVASKERLKDLNGQNLTDEEMKRVNQLNLDENSKGYLIRFMTDYSWWFGAKTIDRGDFYVSPILNSARLVNASQSFVADLCAFLADKKELINAIISVGDNTKGSEPLLLINESQLTSFILSTIRYFDKKDSLKSIIPYTSENSPIKVFKEDSFKLVGMFLESTIEDVRNRNTPHSRWFEETFKLGERNVFLSTQWNAQGDYQLTLPDFIELIRCCYGKNYSYQLGSNGEHQLYLAEERLSGREINESPLQQIFYGAPGTGKSYEINRITKTKEVIRTTFHPDSDYSTFVGAYKPTSIEVPVRDVTGKVIVENGRQVTENRIVYDFVEQAFLQAYTKAWKAYAEAENGEMPKELYLVIEEINRGNCAQIFGDLFQLLDRNAYGFSDYPITADKDMKKQLSKAFKNITISDAERINSIYGRDVVSQVLNGEILLLPDNLYIWATMNTSDQSLFPIDSAFKRRWDWKYMPICEGKDNGQSLNWKIKVKDNLYDWWQFVEKINAEINEQTKSEDKKLGYFFCKAQNGIISAETFVSKVVFYLWNDVFKDQAFASDIFRDGDDELTFNKFYDVDNNGKAVIKENIVELFLNNLGVDVVNDISNDTDIDMDDDNDSDDSDDGNSKIKLTVTFPDGDVITGDTKFESYSKALRKIGLAKAESIASEKKYYRRNSALIDTVERDEILRDPVYSYENIDGYYVVKGINGKTMRKMLRLISEKLDLGIVTTYQ